MKGLVKIISNRNTILILSMVLGLSVGDIAHYIKPYTIYILALVLSFSTTGITTSELLSRKELFRYASRGFLLNYALFAAVLLPVAYFLSPNIEIFYGFVIIAATPPGVAIIPFSYILNGNIKSSVLGTLGGFLASVVVAPVFIQLFTGKEDLGFWDLFLNMLKIIVVPLLMSRLLLLKPLQTYVSRVRGKVVNWGFALIIFTAVGLNRAVLLSDFDLVIRVSLIFFIAIFVLGQVFDIVMQRIGVDKGNRMSYNLMLTIKSSGFSVVTAIAIFNNQAVVPSAVMSVFVLLYLLFLTFQQSYRQKRIKG